ncbi:MAG: hypothetical protein U0441_11495 [Polyangiaceae bacterium]
MGAGDDRLRALLDAARTDDAPADARSRVRSAILLQAALLSAGAAGNDSAPVQQGTSAAPQQGTSAAPQHGTSAAPQHGTSAAPPHGAGAGGAAAPSAGAGITVGLGKAVVAALVTGIVGFSAGLSMNRGPSAAPPPSASVAVAGVDPSGSSRVASPTDALASASPTGTLTAETPPIAATPAEAVSAHTAPSSAPRGSVRPPGSAQSPATASSGTALADAPRDSALAAELSLLREVQDALRDNDAARADRWLNEHASRFPKGVLQEEREAARVLSLCLQGRKEEAKEAADRFLAANPRSVQSDRVRASCALR